MLLAELAVDVEVDVEVDVDVDVDEEDAVLEDPVVLVELERQSCNLTGLEISCTTWCWSSRPRHRRSSLAGRSSHPGPGLRSEFLSG